MKEKILVDTDIIVQYLKTGKGVLPTAYEKYEMVISAVSYTELLASKTFEDESLRKEVLEFCEKYFTIKEINSAIALRAAQVLRESEVNLATSFIAATALEEGMKLLSEENKNFKNIKGIEMMQI
jgi:predicted nucleic acid-binding protein